MFLLLHKVRASRRIRDTLANLACKSRYRTRIHHTQSVTLQEAPVVPLFTDRSDVASLELHSSDLFSQGTGTLSIINCYSVCGGRESLHTVAPQYTLPTPSHPTLVVGDFNIHHPLSDPLRTHSQAELHVSFPYFPRAADLGYNMLNTPGVYIRFPLSGIGRPSVLDLAFVSPTLAPFFKS